MLMETKKNITPEQKESVSKWWSVIKTVIDIIIAAITAATTTTLMN